MPARRSPDILLSSTLAQVRVLELGRAVLPVEACRIVGAFPAIEELNVQVSDGADGVLLLRACVHDTMMRVGIGVELKNGTSLWSLHLRGYLGICTYTLLRHVLRLPWGSRP